MSRKTIAVVGAGVLGRLISLALASRGYSVSLYDQGTTGTASLTAAGMLAPLCELEVASACVQSLAIDSLCLWSRLIEHFKLDVFFQQSGTVVIAHALDDRLLDEFAFRIARRLKGTSLCALARLDRSALANLEPALAHNFRRALYFPQEGQVDARQMMAALGRAIENSTIDFHQGVVVESLRGGEIVLGGRQQFDLVVDCRGVAASLKGLRGVRGEVIEVSAPEVTLSRPVRLLHPRYPLYVVPREEGRFVIGATQIESEDTAPVTIQSALELLSALFSLDSAFAEANIIEMRSALRPALTDNDPAIFYQQGLLTVNGLYRHGYLLSPKVSELAADIVDNLFGVGIGAPLPDENLIKSPDTYGPRNLPEMQGELICR